MSQPAKAQEPSMEEILASIRRIISDDEAKPAAAAPVATPAAVVVPSSAPPAAPKAGALRPVPPPPAKPVVAPAIASEPVALQKNSQDDIDAMLASFDAEPVTAQAPASVDDDDDDVFELTEQMTIPAPADSFQKIEPSDDLEFSEQLTAVPETPHSDVPQDPRPASQYTLAGAFEQEATIAPVLTGATAAAVESAFNTLANTVLSNNARTLEDLVKEMLRPMLKSWLDDNLPTMVERIVRAEIERVARGR